MTQKNKWRILLAKTLVFKFFNKHNQISPILNNKKCLFIKKFNINIKLKLLSRVGNIFLQKNIDVMFKCIKFLANFTIIYFLYKQINIKIINLCVLF